MALIEILPGVYYDSELPWYSQPDELQNLALEVMEQPPKDSETETSGDHSRLLWGLWESTTETGTFDMRVDMLYEFSIDHRAFLSKIEHDQVTITQIS